MSESGYRDERDAALERLRSLEEKLRDLDARVGRVERVHGKKVQARDAAIVDRTRTVDRTRELRAKIARLRKRRDALMTLAAAVAVVLLGLQIILLPAIYYANGRAPFSPAVLALLALAATAVLFLKWPGNEELSCMRALAEIEAAEDREATPLRVETPSARRNLDDERDEILREIEEARALAKDRVR